MKRNKFGYLIREGVRGIFLHGFMSFAAVCVTVACLIIMGSFSLILYNLSVMVTELEQENEMIVYIDETYTEDQAKSVGSQINMIGNVHNAQFVSREEALQNFVEEQNDPEAFAGLQSDTLRDRFVITLEDNTLMRQTENDLRQIQGVADVSAHYEISEGFTTLQHVLRIASVAIIAVLLVVSLLIISNTVKLAMYDRKDEIAIMKMVGATNGFIRLPFVVEGFTLGMIGAVLAFGLEWVAYDSMIRKITEVDSLQLFTFVPFQEVLIPMVAVFGAAGMFVGIVGSWTSIRKFMDV